MSLELQVPKYKVKCINKNRSKEKDLKIDLIKIKQVLTPYPRGVAGKACNAGKGRRARRPGKAAGQGCQARLPSKAAGQGLPGQGGRARLLSMVQYAECMMKLDNNAVF
jgi:hypothetical protein